MQDGLEDGISISPYMLHITDGKAPLSVLPADVH